MRTPASSPVRDLLARTLDRDVIPLAGGLPDPALFDRDGLAAAFERALRDPANLQYGPTEGNPALRALLAGDGDVERVVVTTGSQQAVALAALSLLEPGEVVLVEEPTYLAALQAFALSGARCVGVAADDEGMLPDALVEQARRHDAKLAYVVPTFANPTGKTLGLARRQALAHAVSEAGVWLIEDDPYGALRYEGETQPPIASLDGAGERTLRFSSLSKVLAPGLRIGWAEVPDEVRPAFVVAKQALDLHTSSIVQAAAAEYLAVEDLSVTVDRARDAYRERRDTLLAGLPDVLPAGSTWTEPEGGMFVWVRLPGRVDTTALLEVALEHGVSFVPGAPFFAGEPDTATLRLAFTTTPPDAVAEGLRRLGVALAATV
jgi:DNA-binding transcriptional MocR family regulator